MNSFKVVILSALLFVAFAHPALASGSDCTGMYGGSYTGSQSCSKISIDKKVQKPGSKDYVDGLSALDPKYHANDTVNFQIVIQNVGSDKASNVTITDSLPDFVTFVSGPGSYDTNSKKLTFNIASLNSGESQTFYIATKVNDNLAFGDNGFMCVTNYARATESNGTVDDDSAQFCIERVLPVYQPAPVKKAPPTGPIDAALPLLFGMGGAGLYLIKKIKA